MGVGVGRGVRDQGVGCTCKRANPALSHENPHRRLSTHTARELVFDSREFKIAVVAEEAVRLICIALCQAAHRYTGVLAYACKQRLSQDGRTLDRHPHHSRPTRWPLNYIQRHQENRFDHRGPCGGRSCCLSGLNPPEVGPHADYRRSQLRWLCSLVAVRTPQAETIAYELSAMSRSQRATTRWQCMD